MLNTPGLVDAGYTGEIKVILLNTDAEHSHWVETGERIAQLVVERVVDAQFVAVEFLQTTTARGAGGFGSTGR